MSQENVETLQRARAAWDADDLDAFLAEADPEVEWNTAVEQAMVGRQNTYRGHDGVRAAWDELRGEAWGGITSQVQEIRDLGESVLVLGHLDVTGRTTGIGFSEELGQLVTFRGGVAQEVPRAEDLPPDAPICHQGCSARRPPARGGCRSCYPIAAPRVTVV